MGGLVSGSKVWIVDSSEGSEGYFWMACHFIGKISNNLSRICGLPMKRRRVVLYD